MTPFEQHAAVVLTDPDVRAALDELTVQVMELCADFDPAQLTKLRTHGDPERDAEMVIALMVGWVLGFHKQDHSPASAKKDRLRDRLMVAAHAAGFSHSNCEELDRERVM